MRALSTAGRPLPVAAIVDLVEGDLGFEVSRQSVKCCLMAGIRGAAPLLNGSSGAGTGFRGRSHFSQNRDRKPVETLLLQKPAQCSPCSRIRAADEHVTTVSWALEDTSVRP
jgi:hypothetical protein